MGKKKGFFNDYKMIYPRLITSMRWKFDCFFEKKKNKNGEKKNQNTVLKNLCNKIVDVINKMFTKKYYFVKISQSKKGHVYLKVSKKERLFGEEKQVLHRKIFEVFRNEQYLLTVRSLKNVQITISIIF